MLFMFFFKQKTAYTFLGCRGLGDVSKRQPDYDPTGHRTTLSLSTPPRYSPTALRLLPSCTGPLGGIARAAAPLPRLVAAAALSLSLRHICRSRRIEGCRCRWSPERMTQNVTEVTRMEIDGNNTRKTL